MSDSTSILVPSPRDDAGNGADTGDAGRDGAKATSAETAPGRSRPGGDRLRALDGMRILAALMVCFYHYTGRGGTVSESWGESPRDLFGGLPDITVYGNLGVEFFFVISGFVICMSCWGRSLGDFFRSRVSRLYPAYWTAIVLVTAASLALPAVAKPVRLDEFLVNLTMLQQPAGAERVLGVCWTLWVELRFYLLFALFVVWKGATYRRVVMFSCLWLVAGVFSRAADVEILHELTLDVYAPFFTGGLALYLIHRYGSDLLLWGIVGVSWLLGQYYVTGAMGNPAATGSFAQREPEVILLVVTLAFASVAAVALGWLRWASWRWLTTAGALTYPFYLIHEHLGWFVIRVLHRKLDVPAPVTLAATIGGMLLLAYAIHRLVERPGGKALKRVLTEQARALPARLRSAG
ncbi:acyltransferase [Spirillospora sp. NPDC047279]|uniref:acyltransferase family protein n=1 Tax=Spirillospora sp. NPDC047279 TaxID=3155478 RepID=UPI0033D7466E